MTDWVVCFDPIMHDNTGYAHCWKLSDLINDDGGITIPTTKMGSTFFTVKAEDNFEAAKKGREEYIKKLKEALKNLGEPV